MTFTVPYGKGTLEFNLPKGMCGVLAEPKQVDPLPDLELATAEALERPVNSPPLRDLARPGSSVCIVFTDITRSSPDYVLVPALLKELAEAGVRDDDVTLLCGIGMHRPSTQEERIAKLGADIVARYRVIDSDPQNPSALADLGTTESGIPLSVHRTAYDADLLVATGIVEPHQYAGYSGGRKTVAVGAAGEPMIAYTHGPKMVDHPRTRLGRIEGNPFHEAVTEAARRAGLRFILNVVLDGRKRPVAVKAGEPSAAFAELVKQARALVEVSIPQQFDVAIGGVGYPKDSNLYQASRAASYLFFAPTPVVKPGGFLIIPARCEEGAGDGAGEQRFLNAMSSAKDMADLLKELRETGYPPGAQRAFVMAKVMEDNPVVIVGSETPEVATQCKMHVAHTMDEALSMASARIGASLDVLVVPNALLTLPIVEAN